MVVHRDDASSPLVTVIIATYNMSGLLRLTLTSLLLQEYANFEAWIVGDACTDDSEQVVESFADPRLHWYNLEQNCGSQAGPNNVGLQRANGKYVAYLSHDDLWLPTHLASLVACLEESNADYACSLSALIGPEGVREAAGAIRPGVTYGEAGGPPSSWMHRRKIIETCGLWGDHRRLSISPDSDYLQRMSRGGNTMVFCPRLTVLKFPAPWFPRIYADVGLSEPIQQKYINEIEHQADNLEHQMLLELAIAFSRERKGGYDAGHVLLKQAVRTLVREQVDRLGRERWPLSAILRWRFQRIRRAKRKNKGLPPT